jgi:hypothetical protein
VEEYVVKDIEQFNTEFPMSNDPLHNFSQYVINNRGFLRNWVNTNCIPCLYGKIKRENANLVNSDIPTEYSKVDKYVIAYGTSNTVFEDKDESYIFYKTNLPIQPESYSKINAQFSDNLEITAPFDERFSYKAGDIVIFRFNEYIFKYLLKVEPTSYLGITYNLSLSYIEKNSIDDYTETKVEPTRDQEEEYW